MKSGFCKRFFSDDRGGILIYVTVMLPVLIGLGLLAVDGARLYNMHTHLQRAADALALAGAAELDLKPDAISRSTQAIANMVDNVQRFADGAVAITVASTRFLSSLPDSDASAITDDYVATGDSVAERSAITRYVEVTVTPRTLTTLLPASYIGGSNTVQKSATAVAGFTSVVCKTMPMFICNPWQDANPDPLFIGTAKGTQIKMQRPTSDGGWGGGNYGWLQVPTSYSNKHKSTVPDLKDAIGRVNPPLCFEQNGVSVKTGEIDNLDNSINVRFDLWGPSVPGAWKTDPDYRPAQNVRKGYTGAGCSASPVEEGAAYRMPRDTFTGDSRLGNNDWTQVPEGESVSPYHTYWHTNYGSDENFPIGLAPSDHPTRYDVYRHEVGTMTMSGNANLVTRTSTLPETGTPQCYKSGGLSDDPDRRVIFAAIINCNGQNMNGGSGGPYPVHAFGKFFITEPVPPNGSPDAGTIFAEFVDVIQPGTVNNDVAKDVVQLYR